MHERTKRLHASNFGKICNATPKTNFENLAKSFTVNRNFTCPAIRHGKQYESTAIHEYSSRTGVVSQSTGIIVSEQFSFLTCSPDGIIENDGVIEVKCPYSARSSLITPDTVPYLLEDNNGVYTLNPKHEYYFQVQGVLFCTGRQFCDFIVWTPVDIKCIKIIRNENFISEMVKKLTDFF